MLGRWHQFGNVTGQPSFGLGTVEQARHHLKRRNAHLGPNHYVLTTFDEGEEPPDGGLVIDLITGDFLPERHARKPVQG